MQIKYLVESVQLCTIFGRIILGLPTTQIKKKLFMKNAATPFPLETCQLFFVIGTKKKTKKKKNINA